MRQLTPRQRRAAVALALVAALFCAVDLAAAPFGGARAGAQGFLGALARGTDPVLGPARRWVQALPHLAADQRTIAAQQQQIARLTARRAELRADAATRRAVALLQLQANRGGYDVVPARVVAIGAQVGFDWTVVLDSGSDDGLRAEQTVLAGADLVGRVIRVAPSSATVLLAADPRSGIGVRDERSGEIGVVSGHGTGAMSFVPLNPAARPRVGDMLLSGPNGSTTYVAGLRVGTVHAVHRARDGSVSISVTPATGPSTLEVVGVALAGGADGARPALVPVPSTPTDPAPVAQGPRR